MDKCSGCFEDVHEPSDYTKCGEIIDWLRRYWLFKKNCSVEYDIQVAVHRDIFL